MCFDEYWLIEVSFTHAYNEYISKKIKFGDKFLIKIPSME
jgi:hypothetical protein